MKKVLKWIAGVIFLVAALATLVTTSYLSSLCFLIAGLFCLPPTMKWIESIFFKGNLKSVFKYIVVIAALVVGFTKYNTSGLYSGVNKDEIVDSILNVRKQKRDLIVKNFDSLAKANSLKIIRDEFKPDITFYEPKDAPKYRSVSWMYPYLIKSGNRIKMKYVIQYGSDNWLFIEKVKIKLTFEGRNDTVMDLYTGRFDRDHGGGRIWEWVEIPVSDVMYMKLVEINNAKSAKIRFVGQKYYNERKLTSKEFKALKNVLNVYQLKK